MGGCGHKDFRECAVPCGAPAWGSCWPENWLGEGRAERCSVALVEFLKPPPGLG